MAADVRRRVQRRHRIHVNPRETTSLGAAMAAGVGAGVYASFADAAKIVHTRDERRPIPRPRRPIAVTPPFIARSIRK